HEIVGQALQVRGLDADRTNVLADGLVKLLADRGDLVAQRLHAGARRIVAVDARQVKVSKDLLDREAGGRAFAGHVQRRDGVVDLAVQAQFRGEPVRFLIRLVSRLTHRGFRIHIEEELRLGEKLLEPPRELVERLERVLNRPRPVRLQYSLQAGPADRAVRARDLGKGYDGRADILRGVDLDVAPTEAVLVFGPNGSGKTTLLSILGGLDVPSRGSVTIGGREISRLKDSALAKIRLLDIGFVFQTHNLIDDLTVEEN